MLALKIIFWTCLALVFYTYLGYGMLLWLIVKLKEAIKGKERHPMLPDNEYPDVTFLVAAYNEEAEVAKKMENCLALDYPKDKLHIVWVTDGSTDRTVELLSAYPSVKVYHEDKRAGKTAAVNRAMRLINTPITVFSDANTSVSKDALKLMVSRFADPKVGCVAGEKRVASSMGEGAVRAEGLYWKYESALKGMDDRLYSTQGAAGELYAIRTDLWTEMPPEVLLDDFVCSMRVTEKGYKIAYENEAYAIESPSANIKEEAKRKKRISAGGMQSIIMLKGLLNPFKHGVLTFQYVSHRVLRWSITPIALVALIPLNIALAGQGGIYAAAAVCQALFYLGVICGGLSDKKGRRNKYLYLCYYFAFMNVSVFRGFKYLFTSDKKGWEKAKRA